MSFITPQLYDLLPDKPQPPAQQPPRHDAFDGVDHRGMPRELVTAETNALRRLSPRRNRWPEVAKFDTSVAELEQQHSQASTELADLHSRVAQAPTAHADALAQWQLNGQQGPRPESETDDLKRQIADRQDDLNGLQAAITRVLGDKTAFVEKHRARLVQDADACTREAHAKLRELLDQVADARSELAELRQASVWAATFPDPSAGQTPQPNLLHGGLRKPVEQALGIQTLVQFSRLLDVLRADADWLSTALTRDQHAATLDGTTQQPDAAMWAATPEHQQELEQERKAALERYKQEWGHYPA